MTTAGPMCRFELSATLVAGVLLGCATHGVDRNPRFSAALAPKPTIAVAPFACHAGGPEPLAADAEGAQFDTLYRSRIPVEALPVDPEDQTVLCAALGNWSPGGGVKDWRARGASAVVLQRLAKQTSAGSIFVSLLTYNRVCGEREENVKDSSGQTVARIDTGQEECHEGRVDYRSYLFGADASLLWDAWSETDDPAEGAQTVLARVPATFQSFHVADSTENTTGSAPSSSGTDFLGGTGAHAADMTPACRKYLRVLCARRRENSEVQARTCAAYAKAISKMHESACRQVLSTIRARKPGR